MIHDICFWVGATLLVLLIFTGCLALLGLIFSKIYGQVRDMNHLRSTKQKQKTHTSAREEAKRIMAANTTTIEEKLVPKKVARKDCRQCVNGMIRSHGCTPAYRMCEACE